MALFSECECILTNGASLKLLNLRVGRPYDMDEIKKGLETYISFWNKWINKGAKQYWNPKTIY